MPTPPTPRNAITQALRECGPMSAPEIAEHLGLARNVINTCMTTTRKNHPGKFFRILRYRPQVGVSGRETPIYSASSGPDAPRPAFDKAQGRADHYRRNRARLAVERYRRRGTSASWLSGLVPLERRATQHTART
ncbi:MAG: hypothetical protein J0H16_19850 [Alicycliphilus denitrificans]|nr:hypothetical protein [Alicycliphilus denitrificans]